MNQFISKIMSNRKCQEKFLYAWKQLSSNVFLYDWQFPNSAAHMAKNKFYKGIQKGKKKRKIKTKE
ncbi:Uncharacterized protein BM_BM1366 [Brugia malayi]|uniref:Bm1366 n=1 Tax=Brugia malayi TaxID=6279 RepID=A0A0K0IYG6_BRUMA|nr:Uncharacterized protein BM_BM1366 [Brugia malayi]CDQ03773.1 Bm1366 [Brugia malayi]VIO99561.1 Uncharacterized protein BM_BM1366 [Brugia malayi]